MSYSSPCSQEAIKSLGYVPEELYHVDINSFLLLYPDFKTLSKDTQKIRYLIYENQRQNKIKEAIIVSILISNLTFLKKRNQMQNDLLSRFNVTKRHQSLNNVPMSISNDLKVFELQKKKQV